MTDIAGLTDLYIALSGADPVDQRLRVRYARAGLLLPHARPGARLGRTPIPQVDVTHACVMLLCGMVGGPQIRTAEAIRQVWSLPLLPSTWMEDAQNGTCNSVASSDTLWFGSWLTGVVELATKSVSRPQVSKLFTTIHVAHIRPHVSVSRLDKNKQAFTQHFAPYDSKPHSEYKAPVSALSLAGAEIILELGEIVARSRYAAAKAGIVLDDAEALESLNRDQSASAFDEVDARSDAAALQPLAGL